MTSKPSAAALKKRARQVIALFDEYYPEAECALNFKSPFQLLAATILSAQCTDQRVNQVTPHLFAKWPSPLEMSEAPLEDIEEVVRSCGFYRHKAKSLKGAAQNLVTKYQGEVPKTLEALTALPGVGRKTANVVLGNAFGIPGLTVDTHLGRVSRRLGLTINTDPEKVEADLMNIIPQKLWTIFSHQAISHGRALCKARGPKCRECPLSSFCPRTGV